MLPRCFTGGIKHGRAHPCYDKILKVADVMIGCSGFIYDHWRGPFYPAGLSKNYWLEYYCKHFNTVELNVTFYRLPARETFSKWYRTAPDGFSFSLKGSRFITHVKKLKDCAEPIEVFFSRASLLKEKLGAILWQFPPTFPMDIDRLKDFLTVLKQYSMKNTFEFRNKTWINKKIIDLLGQENAALCFADYPDFLNKLPLTADFVYMRRHGKDGSYATSYNKDVLKKDAKKIKSYMKQKKDIYIYFNNDAFGYAPKNAAELKILMGKKR